MSETQETGDRIRDTVYGGNLRRRRVGGVTAETQRTPRVAEKSWKSLRVRETVRFVSFPRKRESRKARELHPC